MITKADLRTRAHDLLVIIDKTVSCQGDVRPGISHDWVCEDIYEEICPAPRSEEVIAAAATVVRDALIKDGLLQGKGSHLLIARVALVAVRAMDAWETPK